MESSVWLIIGLIAGGVTGGVATWLISRARGGAVSVMQLKQENDKFRNEVAEHFVETARLINDMTESYKKVFDHLSSGAEKLVDDDKLAERLPPVSGQEVRLGSFGAGSASAGEADRQKAESSRGRNAAPDRKPGAQTASATPSTASKSSTASDRPAKPDEAEKSAASGKSGASSKPATPQKTPQKTPESKPGSSDSPKRESDSTSGAKAQAKTASVSSATEGPAKDADKGNAGADVTETSKSG